MGRFLLYKVHGMACYCKALSCLGLYLIPAQIFAEREKADQVFESLSNQFTGKTAPKDHQFGEFFLLIIAAVVLVFVTWLAYQFLMYRKRVYSPDSAWGLYRKLCQVHNLSLREKLVVRKVCSQNGLDDPLPLFVEPNFFKQVLADATLHRYHPVVQNILDKLFGQWHQLSQQASPSGNLPPEDRKDEKTSDHQPLNPVIKDDELASDPPAVHLEQIPAIPDQEQLTSFPGTKVLLNPIPGRMAFSALVEPISRLSTEIAATSIQHNLTDGRGMNERTFVAFGEQHDIIAEPQSPLFPKPNVPSPSEMLTSETRRADQYPPISPTPQYLRTHDRRVPQREARSKRDDAFVFEDVAMLETIVMGR